MHGAIHSIALTLVPLPPSEVSGPHFKVRPRLPLIVDNVELSRWSNGTTAGFLDLQQCDF